MGSRVGSTHTHTPYLSLYSFSYSSILVTKRKANRVGLHLTVGLSARDYDPVYCGNRVGGNSILVVSYSGKLTEFVSGIPERQTEARVIDLDHPSISIENGTEPNLGDIVYDRISSGVFLERGNSGLQEKRVVHYLPLY